MRINFNKKSVKSFKVILQNIYNPLILAELSDFSNLTVQLNSRGVCKHLLYFSYNILYVIFLKLVYLLLYSSISKFFIYLTAAYGYFKLLYFLFVIHLSSLSVYRYLILFQYSQIESITQLQLKNQMIKNIRHHQRSMLQLNKDTSQVGSRSKSPVRNLSGIKLYNFSKIESYGKIQRPFLNQQKKQDIQWRLAIQKATERRAKKRQSKHHNHSFIPFDYNPFSQNISHSKSEFKPLEIEKKRSTSKKDLIYQLQRLKNSKNRPTIHNSRQSIALNRLKDNTIACSNNMQINISKISKQFYALGKQQKNQLKYKQNLYTQSYQDLNFDEIIAIQQQNVHEFKNQRKDINIFKIIFDKKYYFGGQKTIFDKYHFSFNSTIERLEKFYIPVERDISRKSRQLIKAKINASSEQIGHFNSKYIKFEDLIGVASGRYTSQYVYDRLYNEKASDQQDYTEQQLVYEKLSNNKQTIINNQQTLSEIKLYQQLGYVAQQVRFNNLSQNRKQHINSLLEKQENLHRSTIHHKKIHRQVNQDISQALSDFINSGFNYPKLPHQRNRHVQKNKAFKKKNQIIKMKRLLETFFIKKEKENSIKDLVNKRM